MTELLGLIVVIGLLPLVVGVAALGAPARHHAPIGRLLASSALLCALSFNLTFLWQELWLVLPKAMTPGLHPVLYHNDHAWSGDSPVVELLQGSGAVATLASGLASFMVLRAVGHASSTWRLFWFWMAFQGLNQSLTQLAIGAILPGNDVGRALTYLRAGAFDRHVILVFAVAMLAGVGFALARRFPWFLVDRGGPRAPVAQMVWPALLSIVAVIPFRLPRDFVEVVLVPVLVTVVGLGWLRVGAAIRRPASRSSDAMPSVIGPASTLAATLVFFQVVLRHGVRL